MAKFATNASGAIWWSNLQLRCASGNVYLLFDVKQEVEIILIVVSVDIIFSGFNFNSTMTWSQSRLDAAGVYLSTSWPSIKKPPRFDHDLAVYILIPKNAKPMKITCRQPLQVRPVVWLSSSCHLLSWSSCMGKLIVGMVIVVVVVMVAVVKKCIYVGN